MELVAFADDIVLLSYSESDMVWAFDTLGDRLTNLGLSINIDKCEGLSTRKWRGSIIPGLRFPAGKEGSRYLGLQVLRTPKMMMTYW